MIEKKKIAIIGGGIAGLTFARCLGSDEYDINIFERKEDFGEIGAAISVFPNALCVMDELGLLADILKNSGEFKTVYLKTDSGDILSKSEPKTDYPVICIHRADLHAILLKNLDAKLHNNSPLKELSQLENGQIKLTFDNGESGVFDAVIGADGIHSQVRKHVFNDGEPIFRGYNVWRGVVKTDFDIGYGSETFGKGQRVGIVPIKDGVYGWWATCNEDFMQDDSPEGAKAKLNRLFSSWHAPIPDLIRKTDNILKNGIMDRKLRNGWTKGPVTLIGDAAHPTTPNLGQGGCMAIEGAYILAKSLQKYGLTKMAFDRYEELHYPRAKSIVKESLKLGKMGQLTNPLLIGLRNFAFKAMPSSVAMKMIDKYFSYRVTKLNI
ncbi:FAD-dependent monooxygenase [Litoribacter ruber]|uniref:FAD-dependent monooxygenase n=1 Tax=Litoribacter ruber TaxID=702568 RepID=UPI001BDA7906|nr:FAD-dependent monooxygenase [Litoribacter ruber]MBT0810922.1 FAD-dependent monooxygenase [Litoribacter ruber]